MSDIIKKYYLLCTARLGGQRGLIINAIPREHLEKIINKKEISIFLRDVNGTYVAKESVTGGDDEGAEGTPVMGGGTQKRENGAQSILVFGSG